MTIPIHTKEEVTAMRDAVFNLFETWGVKDNQAQAILGNLSIQDMDDLRRGKAILSDLDLGTRLQMLLGIHRSLRLIYEEKERGYSWMKRENAMFGSKSPLEIISSGSMDDLTRVFVYLENANR